MEYAKQCTPLGEYTVQFLLSRTKLVFFYGGTFLEYGAAVTMVPRVGRAVAQALAQLPPSVTIGHLVGHSLGAQVTGHIARNLPSRPRFIVGLDPAGPLFYPTMFGCQDPISSTDADHVTVLHTDWSRLGANEWTGSVDFMPHDGHRPQPGCNNINNLDIDKSSAFGYAFACSHNRAIMLFANAISNSSSVVGTQCYSYAAFTNKLCQNNPKAYLTQPSEKYIFIHGNECPYYFITANLNEFFLQKCPFQNANVYYAMYYVYYIM
ncbi:Phospholipase A1, partial [Gryllus bimaculatus]